MSKRITDLELLAGERATEYLGESVYQHLPMGVAMVFEQQVYIRAAKYAQEYEHGNWEFHNLDNERKFFLMRLQSDLTFHVSRSSNFFDDQYVDAEALSLMMLADAVNGIAFYCNAKGHPDSADWASDWYYAIQDFIRQHPDVTVQRQVSGFLD